MWLNADVTVIGSRSNYNEVKMALPGYYNLNQNIPKNHPEFPGSPLRDFSTAGGKIAFP